MMEEADGGPTELGTAVGTAGETIEDPLVIAAELEIMVETPLRWTGWDGWEMIV